MGQNPKCLRRVLLPPPSPVLSNIHAILPYDVPHTQDVGLPSKNSGSMLGQRCSPLLVQCRSIVYDADPALIYHTICCILCANMCHSTNTVSMLTHSHRRWPIIEKALGDCTVFSDCCIMLVTFKIPAPETPDNTIDWPNADVMLGHCLRRWASIIPIKALQALNHKYNREYYYFSTLVNDKST